MLAPGANVSSIIRVPSAQQTTLGGFEPAVLKMLSWN
jgi:hypothetical protein